MSRRKGGETKEKGEGAKSRDGGRIAGSAPRRERAGPRPLARAALLPPPPHGRPLAAPAACTRPPRAEPLSRRRPPLAPAAARPHSPASVRAAAIPAAALLPAAGRSHRRRVLAEPAGRGTEANPRLGKRAHGQSRLLLLLAPLQPRGGHAGLAPQQPQRPVFSSVLGILLSAPERASCSLS